LQVLVLLACQIDSAYPSLRGGKNPHLTALCVAKCKREDDFGRYAAQRFNHLGGQILPVCRGENRRGVSGRNGDSAWTTKQPASEGFVNGGRCALDAKMPEEGLSFQPWPAASGIWDGNLDPSAKARGRCRGWPGRLRRRRSKGTHRWGRA